MTQRLSDLVNPFYGAGEPGNCLVGPYRPRSIVRLGPDQVYPQATSGYHVGQPIDGFSHTHVAGTGGPGRYGNIRLLPYSIQTRENPIPPYLAPDLRIRRAQRGENEQAEVGRYAISMPGLGVDVELTSTPRVGVHRYRFVGPNATVRLDASAVVQCGAVPPGHMAYVERWDSVAENTGGVMEHTLGGEIVGRADFRGGWGHHEPYSVFYCLRSRTPIQRLRMVCNGGILPGFTRHAVGKEIQAFLDFEPTGEPVELLVGISFVSVANARASIDREVGTKRFEDIVEESKADWDEALSCIEITGGTTQQRTLLYSSLYRLFCMPTDLGIDDENPHWRSGVRQFTDFYCIWDSVRNANSLLNLITPDLSANLLNSLLDIAEQTGWLPDAHIAGYHAFQQGANGCDILFAEAALKGLPGVDYNRALDWIVRTAETPSPDPLRYGRFDQGGDLPFLPNTVHASVSRHIEVTYHDNCIARLAEHVGRKDIAEKYHARAARVWNLWRSEKQCFWPKNPDGTWDERASATGEVATSWQNSYTYEGAILTWSLSPLGDLRGLIDRIGGDQAFVRFLDDYFATGLFHTKETRMHIPHLYSLAGRPDLAADRVAESLAPYAPTTDGIRDNEDMGCQAGYYICNTVGLYPHYGQTTYFLTPPVFDEVQLGRGDRTIRITADRSRGQRYIAEATVNGRRIDGPTIDHADLTGGAHLHYILSDTPNSLSDFA